MPESRRGTGSYQVLVTMTLTTRAFSIISVEGTSPIRLSLLLVVGPFVSQSPNVPFTEVLSVLVTS